MIVNTYGGSVEMRLNSMAVDASRAPPPPDAVACVGTPRDSRVGGEAKMPVWTASTW